MTDPVNPPADPVTHPADPATPAAPPTEPMSPSELEVLKAQLRAAQKKAKDFEKMLEAEKIAKLTNEKNWEEIARLQQQRADEAEGKLTVFSQALVSEKKMAAIKEAAIRAKVKPQMLDIIERLDYDDVIVETTSTGRVQVLGADKAIERVKMKWPDMFGTTPVSVSATSPETLPPTGQVSYDQLKAAQEKWSKSRSKADEEHYKGLLIKFKAQG